MKIGKKEKLIWLEKEPKVPDIMNGLQAAGHLPRSCYRDVQTAVALARKFNAEVVIPVYKKIDLECQSNPDYLPVDFINICNSWSLFTLWIPKLFGGGGLDLISLYPFLEEISSVCVGLANVIGVHYLGVGTLSASWNVPLMNRIFREVKKGEKDKKACLLSLAVTEPEAGTDVEEPLLLKKARVGTIAKETPGGFILNGRKIFISNGHVSTWHMVIAYTDRSHPEENSLMAAVKTGSDGFSFGHKENKMGQKACPASELIFEDCFVPDEFLCTSPAKYQMLKKSRYLLNQHVIDFVVSSSRAGVAAFAAGSARGAYETALNYAKNKKSSGTLLINQEWAQSAFAEMYKNVNTARLLYLESAYTNILKGMYRSLYGRFTHFFGRFLPAWYFRIFVSPVINSKIVSRMLLRKNLDEYAAEDAEVSTGWASLAKFAASDLAIENCRLALAMMGIDGLRHDTGVEKYLRDARLLQIYEGTNQLNRLNLFKNMIARNDPSIEVFQ